jgi:hypothetical protein
LIVTVSFRELGAINQWEGRTTGQHYGAEGNQGELHEVPYFARPSASGPSIGADYQGVVSGELIKVARAILLIR